MYCFSSQGNFAKHRMVPRGGGFVYKGKYPNKSNPVVRNGRCFQCSRCRIVLVCQGSPDHNPPTPYGYYATWQAQDKLSSTNTDIWTNNVQYSSSTKLPQFELLQYWELRENDKIE